MAVIVIFMVEAGMTDELRRQLNSLGPNTLYVHKWAWGVSGNDWWKLRNRPVVSQLDYRALVANATLPVAIAPIADTEAVVGRGDKEVAHVDVDGTAEAFLDAGGWQLRRGRFISDLDHELGIRRLRHRRRPGGRLLQGPGARSAQRLRVGPTARCTVVGSLVRKGNAFGRSQDGLLVMPLSSFLRSFGAKRGLTIAVVAPAGKVIETEDEIVAVMRTARRLGPGSGRQLLRQPAGQDPPGLQPDDDGHQRRRHPGGRDHRDRRGHRHHEHPPGLGEGADARDRHPPRPRRPAREHPACSSSARR